MTSNQTNYIYIYNDDNCEILLVLGASIAQDDDQDVYPDRYKMTIIGARVQLLLDKLGEYFDAERETLYRMLDNTPGEAALRGIILESSTHSLMPTKDVNLRPDWLRLPNVTTTGITTRDTEAANTGTSTPQICCSLRWQWTTQ
ncbi:hypothetical protein SeMB42_g07852 [Synchytrium endobioticum]|uniref:Uncharacterized protein n=1 Tax=Synchytrium endobioticum TaxID=286115 RepID=A0A507D642_9FUNG|nr:hypothetical protein SeMB42_g07852 [Synchytrium endobioticum]TPX46934.1 hypothetical protein SeLEV6574_g02956 [Synchytrium endobioticum]